MTNFEKRLMSFLTYIFKKIEEDINKSDHRYFNNYDTQQLAQRCGMDLETGLRIYLKEKGIKVKCGDPKNINEDDNLIIGHPIFDHECKLTLKKYTPKTGKPKSASWWTSRQLSGNKKRNFICCEAEYKNNEFKFTKIYVSFQKLSYNDFFTNWMYEDVIKNFSFEIKLR